jgi:hypothetical protein
MAIHLTGGGAIAFLLGVPLAIGITAAVLLRSVMWGAITSIGVLVLMFAMAALPIKRKATREDVAKSIEDFVNGNGGPWDWDDFISCRIADEELETIRIKCLRTQSEYPAGPNRWCNDQGIDVLRDLVRQLRSRE